LSQGRYFGGPAQLDLPVAGFDFQEIAFLEVGLLDDRLRDTHGQTIAPLDHLSLHNLAPCLLTLIRRKVPRTKAHFIGRHLNHAGNSS